MDEEPLAVACNSNHLRATAKFQFSTNHARKYRFRSLLFCYMDSEPLAVALQQQSFARYRRISV
jgi:hypothetical protein